MQRAKKNNNTDKRAKTMAAGVTDGFVELYSQDASAIDKQDIVDKSPESVTDNVENENGHDIIEYEMKEYLQ